MKFCPDSRGHFKDVQEMNETIIQNFNSVLTEDDHLYILGDVSFGNLDTGVEYLKRINGTKTLVTGNHDRKLLKNNKFNTERGLMGLVEVVSEKIVSIEGVHVHMYHFPIAEWDQCHRGSYHLHGHQHNGANQVITHRKMDVGVDSNKMFPYSWDEIHNRLKVKPVFGHHE